MRCLNKTVLDDGVAFPCGNCTACAARSAGQKTSVQMLEYYNSGSKALFITLTFNDENLELTTEYQVVAIYREEETKWLDHVSKMQNKFEYLVVEYDEEEKEVTDLYWRNLLRQFKRNQIRQFKRKNSREPRRSDIKPLMAKAIDKVHDSLKPWGFVHIPEGAPTINVETLQKFHKRLRKNISKKLGGEYKYRHFSIGEYGGKNGRPHYHTNLYLDRAPPLPMARIKRLLEPIIRKSWTYGNTKTKEMQSHHAGYMSKYLAKKRRGFIPPRSVNDQKYTTVWGTPQTIQTQSKGNRHTTKKGLGSAFIEPYADRMRQCVRIYNQIPDGKKLALAKCIILRQGGYQNYNEVKKLYPEGLTEDHVKATEFMYQFAMGSTPLLFNEKGKDKMFNMPLPYQFRRKVFDKIMSEESRKEINALGQDLIQRIEDNKPEAQKQRELAEAIEKQADYEDRLEESILQSANIWTA